MFKKRKEQIIALENKIANVEKSLVTVNRIAKANSKTNMKLLDELIKIWSANVEIKPCPYCGAQPNVLTSVNMKEDNFCGVYSCEHSIKYQMKCMSVFCKISPETSFTSSFDTTTKQWNERYDAAKEKEKKK